MKSSFTLIFLFFCINLTAQISKDKLIGDWKFYQSDEISFEFLRLNPDGTGIKCFGQTINGTDTLFLNHITTILVKKWNIDNQKLILEGSNTLTFKINPAYKLTLLDKDRIKLQGEHLLFYLYPTKLNRNNFQRSVTYQRVVKLPKGYVITKPICIVQDRNLFSFKPLDNFTQVAGYKGFDDLIPFIVSCNHGYEYVKQYSDPPYTLEIPISITKWSFGFGHKNFYISFDSEKGDTSETSIVIYYDFENELKNYYFSEIENGKEKRDIVRMNGFDIYKTINWQGKYEGKVFLSNTIVLAYYTKEKSFEQKLQKCITSFKYN